MQSLCTLQGHKVQTPQQLIGSAEEEIPGVGQACIRHYQISLINQLYEGQLGDGARVLQVPDLERLDEGGLVVPLVRAQGESEAVGLQNIHQHGGHVGRAAKAQAVMPCGVPACGHR